MSGRAYPPPLVRRTLPLRSLMPLFSETHAEQWPSMRPACLSASLASAVHRVCSLTPRAAAACSNANPLACSLVRAVFSATGVRRPELLAGGNGRFGRRDFLWHSGSEIVIQYNKRNVLGFAMDFAEDWSKTSWGMEFTWTEDEAYTNTKQRQGFSLNDTYGLTVSVDRPTFVRFLNANRSFFFNSQFFFRHIGDYEGRKVFDANGPLNVLGTFTVFTGYFQDRLNPMLTFVHDIRSTSGGILGSITYRFSEAFSATVGASGFYGGPEYTRVPLRSAILWNQGGNFETRTKYEMLSALADRDEIYLTLRYSF